MIQRTPDQCCHACECACRIRARQSVRFVTSDRTSRGDRGRCDAHTQLRGTDGGDAASSYGLRRSRWACRRHVRAGAVCRGSDTVSGPQPRWVVAGLSERKGSYTERLRQNERLYSPKARNTLRRQRGVGRRSIRHCRETQVGAFRQRGGVALMLLVQTVSAFLRASGTFAWRSASPEIPRSRDRSHAAAGPGLVRSRCSQTGGSPPHPSSVGRCAPPRAAAHCSLPGTGTGCR